MVTLIIDNERLDFGIGLTQLGLTFTVRPADIDETLQFGEQPEAYVCRMAIEKASTVAVNNRHSVVLGSDTIVVCPQRTQGAILGKPVDALQAIQFLRHLSGRKHQVMTAIALRAENISAQLVHTSEVHFRAISDREISHYVATGESMDKAGGYAIQGRAAVFVEHLVGSYSGVMGLPLAQTAQLLQRYDLF